MKIATTSTFKIHTAPKMLPLTRVAELRLVYGVNDALYKILKDQVTVYNANPKIEIATAPIERIVFWGLPAALNDGVPPETLLTVLPQLITRLQVMKSIGMGFQVMSTKTLFDVLTSLGIFQLFSAQKLQSVFKDGVSTTWYTITAEGHMGRASRKIRAVFQASEGTFYYVRVE